MYIILLKFSTNKPQAAQHMDAHNAWLDKGFSEEVFILSGSLQPGLGGSVLAHNTSLTELEQRVANDPFVEHNIVTAEILEITPGRANEQLAFLVG